MFAGLGLMMATVASADPLTVVPGVTLSEEYTDNLYFEENPQDDYITRLFLNLGATYDTPRSSTTLSTGTSVVYLAKHTSQSGLSLAEAQQLYLSSTYQYSPPLSFTINDGFAHSGRARDLSFILSPGSSPPPPPSPDPSGNNPNNSAVVLPRGSALNNSFGVAAAYVFVPRWTTTLSYANGYGRYTEPDATNLVQTGALTLGHQLTPTVSLGGSYAYSRFNNTAAPDNQSNVVSIGGGYTYSPLWTAFGSVGASFNQSLEPGGAPQRTNAVFNLGVTHLFEQRAGITVGASQQVTPSVGVAASSITLTGYLAAWAQITQFLTGTLSVTYSNFNTSSTDFYALTAQVGLFYPVWRNVYAGLIYGYRQRDSEPGIDATQGQTINGNSVRIQISTSWPFRFDL